MKAACPTVTKILSASPAGIASAGTRILLVVWLLVFATGSAVLARQDPTSREELANRFAPVIVLQAQQEACDENGEPFLPAPVDVVFDDEAVVLREGAAQDPRSSPIESGDLFALGDGFATDLPGKPREPGCDYETHFKQVMGNQRPVIYANIATEEGREGIALQYWFFYYYNEFNNLHEGDWEMIQLRFDATSVEEALTQEPVAVAYAQHDGGERADWDAPKVEREGLRPIVYASRGSHASYYGPGLWLGWGQDNSGLGCDVAGNNPVRIDPEVRLIPETIASADDPFAWVTYGGRWGERDTMFYNGPTGPAFKTRWTEPISWMEGLRADSIRVSAASILGPTPSDVFCEAVATGSGLFTLFKPYPWLVGGIVVAGIAIAIFALRLTWPILRDTWRLYRAHVLRFAAIGAVTVPISLAVSILQYLIANSAGFVAATGLSEDAPIQDWLDVVSLVQRGLLLLLVTPVVILTVADITGGRQPSLRRAFDAAIHRLFDLLRTLLRGFVIVSLLTITVIGIPWAINRSVKWMFGAQATMLDQLRGRTALAESAAAVRGRWLRAAVMGGTLGFLGAAPGVLVALALMIVVRVPADAANGLSSLVYAVAHPFAIAGLTLLFLRWTAGSAEVGSRE
jgi:hypothetical protein